MAAKKRISVGNADSGRLFESSAHFRRFFESPFFGAAIYKVPDKNWIAVNETFCRFLGYQRYELESLTWVDLTHPDDLAENIRLFEIAISSGGSDDYSMEKRFLRKDGSAFNAAIYALCVRDGNDQPDYNILLVQDVNAEKAARQSVVELNQRLAALVESRTDQYHESEARFRDFAEISADWFWETDAELRFSYFSSRFEEITGVNPEQLIGNTRAEVGAPGADSTDYAELLRSMEAREPFRGFRHTREHKDGTIVHLSISGRPVFDEQGVFVGYRGVGEDITDKVIAEHATIRQRDEERTLGTILRLALAPNSVEEFLDECINELVKGVPWFEPDSCGGMFLSSNTDDGKSILHPVGHQSTSGRPENVGPYVQAAQSLIQRAFETGEIQFADTTEYGNAADEDSITGHAEYSIPIKDDGNVVGVMVLFLPPGERAREDQADFLERIASVLAIGIDTRRKSAQVKRSMMETEQASRAKSAFLATISHELRTPLNAMIGFGEMLSTEVFGPIGSEKYKNYADNILASARHLHGLVGNILDISAIETDELRLSPQTLDVEAVIAESLRLAKTDGACPISLKVDAGLPPLWADRMALTQILINLLTNARKFTPPDGKITLAATTTNGSHVFTVRDTGRGIEPERIPELTKPFVSSGSDVHLAQSGAGLGLAIVQGLVDRHRGALSIESAPGKGMTVSVCLPSEAPPEG